MAGADMLNVVVDGRDEWGRWEADVELSVSVEAWRGSLDEVREELVHLGLSPGLGGYRLRDERDVTQWGASAIVVTLALSVGGWLAAGASYELAKAALLAVVRSRADGSVTSWPLTRQQAEHQARWRAEARYGLDADHLVCIEEEQHDDGRFRFVFEAPDGRRAEVEIENTEGLVRTTRTRLLAAREG